MNWADGKGTLEAGGRALEWRALGPSPLEAPTLVLLHEGLGSAGLWRDVPARLAEATGWGVLAYSRAGYGASDPATLPRPLDYMTREALQVLPEVLNAVGFQRGVLFGHSDGATIAAIHAGSLQDHRVRGLVLIAPHFFTEAKGLAEIARARQAFESGDLRARLARHHSDPDNAFRGWNDAWLDPGFADWDVSEVIDYIRVPVLAVQGTDDAYGTMAQIDEIEARSYAPVDRLDVPGAGHAPHLEAGETVLPEIAEFVARLQRMEEAGPEQVA